MTNPNNFNKQNGSLNKTTAALFLGATIAAAGFLSSGCGNTVAAVQPTTAYGAEANPGGNSNNGGSNSLGTIAQNVSSANTQHNDPASADPQNTNGIQSKQASGDKTTASQSAQPESESVGKIIVFPLNSNQNGCVTHGGNDGTVNGIQFAHAYAGGRMDMWVDTNGWLWQVIARNPKVSATIQCISKWDEVNSNLPAPVVSN